MAVKPTRIFILIIIFVIAGVGLVFIIRSRLYHIREKENERFISTYAELSIAREKFYLFPESLDVAYKSIYAANKTDSARVSAFSTSLSKDIHQSRIIWDKIIEGIDSLRAVSTVDTAAAN